MNDSASHREHGISGSRNAIVLLFFVTGFCVSLLSAVVFYEFATAATASAYSLLVWGCMAVAVVFAVAGWWVRNAPVGRAVLVATWSATALVCMISVGLGEGIHALALGFFSVLICVATVVAGVRAGALMTAFCALWVVVLTYGELEHWVRGAAAVAASPLFMRVMTLLLMLASSFSVGIMVARVVAAHLVAVHTQEARYRELFEQSPTALLLHRAGEVLDANRAARALIASLPRASTDDVALPTQVDPLRATASTNHHAQVATAAVDDEVDDDDVLAAVLNHAQSLEQQPVGAHLPTAEIVLPIRSVAALSGIGIAQRALQVSAVRADGEDGPATLSMFFDDSARWATEHESQRSRALLANLFEASPDCIMLGKASSNSLVMVNDEFLRVTGYSLDEVIGKSPLSFGLWLEKNDQAAFRRTLLSDNKVDDMSAVFVTKRGEHRRMLLSAKGFPLDGESYAVMVARDVTQNEQMRREQQAILSNAALGIALSQDGRITHVNEACEAMFGFSPGEMVDLPELSLGRSDEEALPALRAQLERGEQVDAELIAKRHDGSTFWCRLRGRSVDPTRPLSGGVVWIVEDVTERRRMAQSLADARDAAEAASRAKTAFLANTSHEIRTPLNGLIGLARIALRDKTDQPTRMRYLRQMLDSAESLAEIMGSVLDMSKIEAGKLAVEELSFDLHSMLNSLHSTYAAVTDQRQLRCVLNIAADVPRLVHGDPLRTRQIVSNFVTNALKFTERGEVIIAARRDGEQQIRIEVRDTGIGVDAPTLARLFRPFTQADESTTRRFGGTGLGLSICRELASLLGGSVGAESSPGHGSVFWVTLPLAKTHAVQKAVQHAVQLAVEPTQSLHATVIRASTQSLEATAPLANVAALIGARVLLAEDNPINMIIATTLLNDWGCVVTEVGNGQLAVEAVDAATNAGAPIDLVLMDVQMPVLDGFGATRALRERYADDMLPIVALTAGVLAAEREDALACGMNAFHVKPFNERALQQTVIDLLTRQRSERRRVTA